MKLQQHPVPHVDVTRVGCMWEVWGVRGRTSKGDEYRAQIPTYLILTIHVSLSVAPVVPQQEQHGTVSPKYVISAGTTTSRCLDIMFRLDNDRQHLTVFVHGPPRIMFVGAENAYLQEEQRNTAI